MYRVQFFDFYPIQFFDFYRIRFLMVLGTVFFELRIRLVLRELLLAYGRRAPGTRVPYRSLRVPDTWTREILCLSV